MSGPAAALDYSEDALLGGRVRLRQPVTGYRAAIDPVLLAAAVPAEPQDHVLDMGCGVGAALLCLAARVEGCRVTGFELQRDLVRLAGDNIVLNEQTARLSVMQGDLRNLPPRLSPGAFHHVMVNPPYLAAGAGTAALEPGKALATREGDAQLGDWLRIALAMVRAKGSITIIHRADRIEVLLAHLVGRAGDIAILPFWPGAGKPAKRVVVRARKQVGSPTRLLAGVLLHEADGRFTAAAQSVLRDAAALPL